MDRSNRRARDLRLGSRRIRLLHTTFRGHSDRPEASARRDDDTVRKRLMADILACAASRYRPNGGETGGLMAHGISDGLRQTG